MRLSVNLENATLFKPTDPIPKQNLVHEKSTKSALPEYNDSAKKLRSDLVDQRI